MFSVEATKPCVSMTLPAPNTIPLGLIRNTRPLEPRVPSIWLLWLGLPAWTRLSTVLAAFCCWK